MRLGYSRNEQVTVAVGDLVPIPDPGSWGVAAMTGSGVTLTWAPYAATDHWPNMLLHVTRTAYQLPLPPAGRTGWRLASSRQGAALFAAVNLPTITSPPPPPGDTGGGGDDDDTITPGGGALQLGPFGSVSKQTLLWIVGAPLAIVLLGNLARMLTGRKGKRR